MIQFALGLFLASSMPIHEQGSQAIIEKQAGAFSPVLEDIELFPYLKEQKVVPQWDRQGNSKFPIHFGYDLSGFKAVSVNQLTPRLKVLVAVAERDYTDAEGCSSLETRDKQRILVALSRVRSVFQSLHNGLVDVEFVIRFVPEPIFTQGEFEKVIQADYNFSKFEADDSVERGPFAAQLLYNTSVSLGSSVFAKGVARPDSTFEKEVLFDLLRTLDKQVKDRIGGSPYGQVGSITDGLRNVPGIKLLDPAYQANADAVYDLFAKTDGNAFNGDNPLLNAKAIASNHSSEIKLDKVDGSLRYIEESVTRSGKFFVPIPVSEVDASGTVRAKAIEFDVKAATVNPLSIVFEDGLGKATEYRFGALESDVIVEPALEYKRIRFPIPAGTKTIKIGAAFEKTTRMQSELVLFQFKNFSFNQDTVSLVSSRTRWVAPLANELTSALGKPMSQLDRRRLVSSLSREGLDFHTNVEFKKALADYFNSLDAFVAYRSAVAYGRICFDPKNSDDVALAVQLLQGPPNEYVREAVLGWVDKFPDISNFEGLAPNAVRSSWRVRLAAIGALNAQERGNSKSKIASRQLLLTSTMQESAVVREAAILCLNTNDSDEKRRLEYTMVNEPCELVRFKALEHYLKGLGEISSDVASGILADDSPTLRQKVAQSSVIVNAKGGRDLLRRLVVDIDSRVRVATFQALLKFADLRSEEYQNLYADRSPMVQYALALAAREKRLVLPDEVKATLKMSAWSEVRTLAEIPRV